MQSPNKGSLSAFQGLRVIEIGSWLAVPSATAMLADFGAEVVKIESSDGDPVRRFPQSMRGNDVPSAAFAMLNRNKKSVVLNLDEAGDRARFDKLLGTADVLVNNLRPAQICRLGLDADALASRHPRLIIASLTGLGLRGPDADNGGFDVGAFWARSGFLAQVTQDGSEPAALTGGYGDLMTSLALYAAIVSGLLERASTGRGGLVETSLLQTAAFAITGDLVSHQAYGRVPRARPRLKSRTPLNNSYRTADGRWFFLTCVDAMRHVRGVARALGMPELSEDPRFASPRMISENAAAIIALLDEEFGSHPLSHWAERFAAEGVTWERVAYPDELLNDPQVAANEMTCDWNWDPVSLRGVPSPFSIFRKKQPAASAAPALGADNALLQDAPLETAKAS
ncbi:MULTISPECIES: CaiB/BaiF CoA transferase family protein [unclassified Sphingobium]|uniref:CaiB/BaiF CoA transferase family protein n=1 Tax=unclassified Sphingobium TaxID=2611147 RepID=UPI00191B47CA|nr:MULTISPECIES: CoA transferase [unclassified Sphingobium]CAD7337956.1 Cinnamoyl-CoA:phenyllactate CoA-transferase [Sphingobium sp. S8]CAD7339006.1 Cinnamoyl-CoA:phenyllactate CoA-transferase [Sphingobium sp. S6]